MITPVDARPLLLLVDDEATNLQVLRHILQEDYRLLFAKDGAKALELAERVAANAPLTNFAVLQALPMIAEANPQTGLLMESLMATVAQSDKEAKKRIRAFLDRKTAKVKPT